MSRPAADFLRNNPFFVLAVGIEATPIEIERAAQRWLALLEVGGAKSRQVETPLGPTERTADLVRESLAALRVPEQRRLYALLTEVAAVAETEQRARLAAWAGAPAAIGWQAPWPR
jgi:hypothetical protein